MKFLQEVMVDVRRLDREEEPELDLELDLDADIDLDSEENPDAELTLDIDDETDPEADPEATTEEPAGGFDGPEPDFDGPDLSGGSSGGFSGGDAADGEGDLSLDVEGDPEQDGDQFDGIAQDATEDPNRQGLIRTVKNAHLVYKRETEEGTYEELWLYNVSDFRTELSTKKAILAGTDIPTNKTRSPDGSQTYTTWAAGNAEMLLIRGLPN